MSSSRPVFFYRPVPDQPKLLILVSNLLDLIRQIKIVRKNIRQQCLIRLSTLGACWSEKFLKSTKRPRILPESVVTSFSDQTQRFLMVPDLPKLVRNWQELLLTDPKFTWIQAILPRLNLIPIKAILLGFGVLISRRWVVSSCAVVHPASSLRYNAGRAMVAFDPSSSCKEKYLKYALEIILGFPVHTRGYFLGIIPKIYLCVVIPYAPLGLIHPYGFQ